MVEITRELALTFVPLFFAMDAVGNLPIFLALTQEIEPKHRRRAVHLATLTALGVGLGYVAFSGYCCEDDSRGCFGNFRLSFRVLGG